MYFLASKSFLYMHALFTVDLSNETNSLDPTCLLCGQAKPCLPEERAKGRNSSQQLHRTGTHKKGAPGDPMRMVQSLQGSPDVQRPLSYVTGRAEAP